MEKKSSETDEDAKIPQDIKMPIYNKMQLQAARDRINDKTFQAYFLDRCIFFLSSPQPLFRKLQLVKSKRDTWPAIRQAKGLDLGMARVSVPPLLREQEDWKPIFEHLIGKLKMEMKHLTTVIKSLPPLVLDLPLEWFVNGEETVIFLTFIVRILVIFCLRSIEGYTALTRLPMDQDHWCLELDLSLAKADVRKDGRAVSLLVQYHYGPWLIEVVQDPSIEILTYEFTGSPDSGKETHVPATPPTAEEIEDAELQETHVAKAREVAQRIYLDKKRRRGIAVPNPPNDSPAKPASDDILAPAAEKKD